MVLKFISNNYKNFKSPTRAVPVCMIFIPLRNDSNGVTSTELSKETTWKLRHLRAASRLLDLQTSFCPVLLHMSPSLSAQLSISDMALEGTPILYVLLECLREVKENFGSGSPGKAAIQLI